MTAPFLLLVHGWGLGPDLWDGVRRHLPGFDVAAVDLGYYGPMHVPEPPPGRRVVAIGHSFGLLWLLCRTPFRWDGLVAVNGFPRFTAAGDRDPAVPRRVVDRMVARFAVEPAAVLGEFRRRCGLDLSLPAGRESGRLAADLALLRDGDGRAALSTPLLALAGRLDPIVPPAMTECAFAGIDTRWHPDGGHLLPLTHPVWCAGRIAAFALAMGAPK